MTCTNVRVRTGWALWCPRRRSGAAGAAALAAPRTMREVAWAATARRRGGRGARAGSRRGGGAEANRASLVALPSCLLAGRVRRSKHAVSCTCEHRAGSRGLCQPLGGRRGPAARVCRPPSTRQQPVMQQQQSFRSQCSRMIVRALWRATSAPATLGEGQ